VRENVEVLSGSEPDNGSQAWNDGKEKSLSCFFGAGQSAVAADDAVVLVGGEGSAIGATNDGEGRCGGDIVG